MKSVTVFITQQLKLKVKVLIYLTRPVRLRRSDFDVPSGGSDLRLIAAFNAALSVATSAVRALGHRAVTQAGFPEISGFGPRPWNPGHHRLVSNHTSSQHPWFQDSRSALDKAPLSTCSLELR
jgi:hypothetical protein